MRIRSPGARRDPAVRTRAGGGRLGLRPRIVRGAQHSEESSFWFRARNRLIAWALRRDFPHARSLLEVGCGTGFVLMGLGLAAPDLRRRPRHVGLGRPLVPRWPLNTMLERVMNPEQALIHLGASLPAGGPLLLTAVRD